MSGTQTDLLNLLETSLAGHGWLGRMFGAKHWLRGGSLSSVRTAPISVVAICRTTRPGSPYTGFATLKKEGIPFQSIQIDIPDTENIPVLNTGQSGADVHLCLSNAAPWYTAFNLGAACAAGEWIIFLDGAARPEAHLLAAYRDAFQAHPETLAARGTVLVPGLEACACQTTGSFALAGETELWPLDLDENMAVRADVFFALGGLDESMIGGYGALDFSIRLFGRNPDFSCQRHVPLAQIALAEEEVPDLPMKSYLFQRQRSWLQLNDALKRYLELYGKFWREQNGGNKRG